MAIERSSRAIKDGMGIIVLETQVVVLITNKYLLDNFRQLPILSLQSPPIMNL